MENSVVETKIIKSNSIYSVVNLEKTMDKLPIGNYLISYNDRQGYYLEKQEDFTLPKILYGEAAWTKRWKTAFDNITERNLGILLNGEQGSGKTLIAKKFCIESQMPVILLNENFNNNPNGLLKFLSNPILKNSIIFIDEFEKVFPTGRIDEEESMNMLLTLLDGIAETRFIFLFTTNTLNINKHLLNRLGRIRYLINFNELNIETIRLIADNELKNKNHIEELIDIFKRDYLRTFDTVTGLIRECNEFNLSPSEALSGLNLASTDRTYDIYMNIDIPEINYKYRIFARRGIYNFGYTNENTRFILQENTTPEINSRNLFFFIIKALYNIDSKNKFNLSELQTDTNRMYNINAEFFNTFTTIEACKEQLTDYIDYEVSSNKVLMAEAIELVEKIGLKFPKKIRIKYTFELVSIDSKHEQAWF